MPDSLSRNCLPQPAALPAVRGPNHAAGLKLPMPAIHAAMMVPARCSAGRFLRIFPFLRTFPPSLMPGLYHSTPLPAQCRSAWTSGPPSRPGRRGAVARGKAAECPAESRKGREKQEEPEKRGKGAGAGRDGAGWNNTEQAGTTRSRPGRCGAVAGSPRAFRTPAAGGGKDRVAADCRTQRVGALARGTGRGGCRMAAFSLRQPGRGKSTLQAFRIHCRADGKHFSLRPEGMFLCSDKG